MFTEKKNLQNAFLDGNYNKRAKKPVATNVFIVHLQNTIPFLKLINQLAQTNVITLKNVTTFCKRKLKTLVAMHL